MSSNSSVPVKKVNLSEAFNSFSDCWSPKVAGDINQMQIKLAKLSGEFIWHHNSSGIIMIPKMNYFL